ncbi:spore coat protein [Bacillaceae bacterium]
MPFGAHESMQTHEILSEKINMLEHFSKYAAQCQDPALRQMLERHIANVSRSYNELVSYTHEYVAPQGQPAANAGNVSPDQIRYGLQQPSPQAPQLASPAFHDRQIATAMLIAHKNSAKNQMAAALECADPHVRQMMVNGAVNCAQLAYEVFQFMNEKGWYQVPTLNNHTAKTMLHSYQPVVGQGTENRQGIVRPQ